MWKEREKKKGEKECQRIIENKVGLEGAKAISEMLKVNKQLALLELGSKGEEKTLTRKEKKKNE